MKNNGMHARVIVIVGGLLVSVCAAATAVVALVGRQQRGSILLPNGQTITPAGTQIDVNDRPLGIAVTSNGKQAAVATASNFAPRALHFIDLATQTIGQTIPIGNSFVGLAFSEGNTLYVGGGSLELTPTHSNSLQLTRAHSSAAAQLDVAQCFYRPPFLS